LSFDAAVDSANRVLRSELRGSGHRFEGGVYAWLLWEVVPEACDWALGRPERNSHGIDRRLALWPAP